jgi:hypothetical protein
MSNATEYLNSIVSTLETIDRIEALWWKGDVSTTISELLAVVEEGPEDADYVASLAEFLDNEFDSRADDLGHAYLESALDMWVDVQWRYDHVSVGNAVALLTTGGPRCEVSHDGDGTEVRVDVWWGSDHAYRTVECTPVANALQVVIDGAELTLK